MFKEIVEKKVANNVEQYALEQQNKETVFYKKYLKNHFDRDLAKAIVMPLIYGKTSAGFAADLEAFFAKGSLYPSKKFLIVLASQIVKLLKNDLTFLKVNNFMRMLRSIGKLLFDLNLLTILFFFF